MGVRGADRLQPDLRGRAPLAHVDAGWLHPVAGEEREAERAQDLRGHRARVEPVETAAKRVLEHVGDNLDAYDKSPHLEGGSREAARSLRTPSRPQDDVLALATSGMRTVSADDWDRKRYVPH